MSADTAGNPPSPKPRRARSFSAARSAKTSSGGTSSRASAGSSPREASAIDIQGRAALVALALGSKSQLASVLNVTASQPTRWINGTESPNGENARALVDLDHVVARARLLWSSDDVVKSWLTGHNAFLGGARPIDVVVVDGTGPVIEALDQEMAGGFA